MDVLKPELVWVNNKCYRFFESSGWTPSSEVTSYVEDDYQPSCEEDKPCDMDLKIVPFSGSKLKHTFNCPSMFFAFIIGTKGTMRKKLETETNTTIQVPKIGQEITIVGHKREDIVSACHRINLLIESSRKKLRPTHFISIPMATDGIIGNYEAFKDDILNEIGKTARGVEDVIFQKPFKLHLTIAMLLLVDDDEVKQAAKLLQDCKRDIIDPFIREHGPVTMQMKGVECMNDDPANVKILYGKVNTKDDVLQTLVDKIAEYYTDSGFLKSSTSHVKLHVTLMNVTYKLKEEAVWKPNITFDATNILDAHSETFFGELHLKEIHLSCLKTAITSYYKAAEIITVVDDE